MRQIVLSILVENTPGVLSRISGLFTRRGYNIDSITACTTQDQKFSRITIAVSGDDMILKQIKNQLSKLEDVVKIFELENSKSVCRELILAKVRANKAVKQEVVTIADIFRAKVVDVSKDNLMIELTGNVNKIEAFINLISDFEGSVPRWYDFWKVNMDAKKKISLQRSGHQFVEAAMKSARMLQRNLRKN